MKITAIKSISKELARTLAADGWTVSTLATAAPASLERYPGVGPAKAKSIVEGAQALVNRQGEREARRLQAATVYAPPEPAAGSPLHESVRVRRIRERLNRPEGRQQGE